MSEIEIMYMQIFKRKKQIIEQVKQRTLLFDQHLASKCLPEGTALRRELYKEELISGLLVSHVPPRIPFWGGHKQPIVAASEGDLPAGFYAAKIVW